ncbi:hypothetical protein AVEN_215214-1 [Araneus ventricosus]|uniref:Uncharacterized protein n=1 Tax=Araneus ventricosus TaxID=182803 RepID=A0A4Y2GA76_ARAVE|nr:hypothetical protein AVEN_215214-1 [Araneus ventricosus]
MSIDIVTDILASIGFQIGSPIFEQRWNLTRVVSLDSPRRILHFGKSFMSLAPLVLEIGSPIFEQRWNLKRVASLESTRLTLHAGESFMSLAPLVLEIWALKALKLTCLLELYTVPVLHTNVKFGLGEAYWTFSIERYLFRVAATIRS